MKVVWGGVREERYESILRGYEGNQKGVLISQP